ncbi:unnamed protein product [Anisakis simplex]|uniref:Uncharacterized protein n=2 Tax=Anisakis simplex TaxID=6269 RepID=A0A3P6PGU5_ANISI|nr:unnamed protein product [Anisakis simplex]
MEQYYQPPSSHQSNSKPEHRSHSETGSSLSSSRSADFGSYSEKTFLDRQLNGHSTLSTEIAYLPSSITSPVGYEKYKRLGPDGEESEFTDDKTGMEILQELDSALEEDEQMSLEDIRKGAKDTDLSFRQYATQTYDLLIPEPAIDYDHQTRHNHRFLINCSLVCKYVIS